LAQLNFLFNVTAGASAIPVHLREAATSPEAAAAAALAHRDPAGDLRRLGHRRHHRRARRLHRRVHRGSRLPKTVDGVAVMTIYVVALNRLFWRRPYRLAATRYSIQSS
jgi:NitT/TauT family transport system permease protein